MIKFVPNTTAMKQMKSSESGDTFDVEIEGDKVVYILNGEKFYESNKEFFDDNFFQVELKIPSEIKVEKH